MSFLNKIATAKRILGEQGVSGLMGIMSAKCRRLLLGEAKCNWKEGIHEEVEFWESYLKTKGLRWPDDYRERTNPDHALQSRPAALLPGVEEIHILDVGAGPLTYLGKKLPGKVVKITAVDPLADEYDRILSSNGVSPLVRTIKMEAENLSAGFPSNTFDLVFARNCIDHSYDPEEAILQMLDVAKAGAFVLLEHRVNEAENQEYAGLHQWNFSISKEGDFLIRSKRRTTNMTKKHSARCAITCEIVDEGSGGDLLVTRIRKL